MKIKNVCFILHSHAIIEHVKCKDEIRLLGYLFICQISIVSSLKPAISYQDVVYSPAVFWVIRVLRRSLSPVLVAVDRYRKI